MSYILDALKKSDKQRKKDKIPDLQTIQEIDSPARAPKRPVWPYLLVAVLLANTVVFMLWWRPWQSEKINVAQNTAPAPATVAAPAASPATAPQTKSLQPPPATIVPSGSKGGNPPTIRPTPQTTPATLETLAKFRPDKPKRTPPGVRPDGAPSFMPKRVIPSPSSQDEAVESLPPDDQPEMNEEETAPSDEISDQNEISPQEHIAPRSNFTAPAATAEDSEQQEAMPSTEFGQSDETVGLPSSARLQPTTTPDGNTKPQVIDIMQLPYTIRKDLPEIHIAAHVYAKLPASRLVSINGHVLREGYSLQPGLKLEEITADGVIFSYEGYHFYVGVF